MNRITAIVEGHGDRLAVPGLLRRIAARLEKGGYVDVPEPIRIPKSRLLKPGELERAVRLAALRCGDEPGGIMVLIDADECCPADDVPVLLDRARSVAPGREVRVVLAKHEFESWFIGAAESVAGRRGLRGDLTTPDDPESIGGAKEWLTKHCVPGRSYRETKDQPALVELFDMESARVKCPSFDKFLRDVESLLESEVCAG